MKLEFLIGIISVGLSAICLGNWIKSSNAMGFYFFGVIALALFFIAATASRNRNDPWDD